MDKKYILAGGGILGLLAIGLVLLIALSIAAFVFLGTGDSFDAFASTKQVDLGVRSEPELFSSKLAEEGIVLSGPETGYCLECEITYGDAEPAEIAMSSDELTSYLQATNNEKGTLKNLQVRLGDENELEASAYVDLADYGHSFSGPVYARGRLEKATDKSIRLDVEDAKAGPIPVPQQYLSEGGEKIEDAINSQLAQMPGLRIDSLEIDDGMLRFEGDFPKTMSTP